MKILESYSAIARSLYMEAEVPDDKLIKYKKKDGEEGEMAAKSAKSMPKDHPAKLAYDKMADTGDKEEPSGGGMGAGDFERDSGDGEDDDWGPGATDDPTGGQPGDKVSQQVEDESKEVEAKSEELAKKYGLEAESDSLKPHEELYFTDILGKNAGEYGENSISPATYNLADYSDEATGIGYAINIGKGGDVINFDSKEEMMKGIEKVVADKKVQDALNKGEITDIEDHVRKIAGGEAVFGKSDSDDEPKKDVKGREYDPMTGKGKGKDSRNEPDDEEYFKSMMGGGDTGKDADSGAVDGPSPEDGDWDSEQVMTAKLDGEEVGDIIDKGEEHPNYDKAMDYVLQFDPDDEKLYTGTGWKGHSGAKEETVTINGKKYRPIKESKKHILKENYERLFRSLK